MYAFLIMFVCSRCNGMLYSSISLTGPSRINGVSVTKSVKDGNYILNVSWTTHQSELPSAEYEVEYRTSDTESWSNHSVSPPSSSTLLTGLNGYIVRVRALSVIGPGEWSEEITSEC